MNKYLNKDVGKCTCVQIIVILIIGETSLLITLLHIYIYIFRKCSKFITHKKYKNNFLKTLYIKKLYSNFQNFLTITVV